MKRVDVGMRVKLNAFGIISEAVEEGVAHACNRVGKYDDGKPKRWEDFQQVVEERVTNEVLGALCAVLTFEE